MKRSSSSHNSRPHFSRYGSSGRKSSGDHLRRGSPPSLRRSGNPAGQFRASGHHSASCRRTLRRWRWCCSGFDRAHRLGDRAGVCHPADQPSQPNNRPVGAGRVLLGSLVSDQLPSQEPRLSTPGLRGASFVTGRPTLSSPASRSKKWRSKTKARAELFGGWQYERLTNVRSAGLRSESRVEIGGMFPTSRSSTQSPSLESFHPRS